MEQQRELFTGQPPSSLVDLEAQLTDCRACPRLVAWREQVARDKRASFSEDTYWGRPVPGFGDPAARILVLGLAPAAHGANRTGRMFTGDRSGEWLYRALFKAGLASSPESIARGDGLTLSGAWITAPVRCAPPQNRPTPAERHNCAAWLDLELGLLPEIRVFVVLGQIAYHALWAQLGKTGVQLPKPRPKFGHGLRVDLDEVSIVASYHPSQQNTFTGRLTEPMLDDVFDEALVIANLDR